MPGETPCPSWPDGLDREAFALLVALDEGQPGFLKEIVTEFEESVTLRLAAIREAVLTGNSHGLELEAHRVKGTSATLGASRLAAVAGSLEAMGRSGQAEASRALLPSLDLEYWELKRALDVVLAA